MRIMHNTIIDALIRARGVLDLEDFNSFIQVSPTGWDVLLGEIEYSNLTRIQSEIINLYGYPVEIDPKLLGSKVVICVKL